MANNEIIIPSSKSYAQRLIICACLFIKNNTSITLHNINMCNDVLACIRVMEYMGSRFIIAGTTITIINGIKKEDAGKIINVGESGTLCRILIPILATFEKQYIVTGEGSILKRDMSSCVQILDYNPVFYKLNNNKLPLELFGTLKLSEYHLDGSSTSQYISGLIIAYAYMNKYCHIIVDNCDSYGYVKITLDVLKKFGANIIEHYCDNKLIDIEINEISEYKAPDEITVEGDWSSFGAIYLAASTLGQEDEIITISGYGLNNNSCQPDCSILYDGWQLFENIKINSDNNIEIKHISEIKPFTVDISNHPDLFPYYAGFATLGYDYSEIRGLHKLVNKESNRGQVIYDEFTKLGMDCKIIDDSIFIKKGKELLDKPYNSHNDHRIGQTLSIIKLINNGHIKYMDECLNKSYPDFIKDIEKIYAKHVRTFI